MIVYGSFVDRFIRFVLFYLFVWNRDLDVCVGLEFMSVLCVFLGYLFELLDELILYCWIEVICRSEVWMKGVYYWIGCLGLYYCMCRLYG